MNEIAQHDSEWNDRLQDLLDGDLSHGERAAVDAHLAGCTRCRSQFARLKRMDSMLRMQTEAPAPHAAFDQQLFARIHAMDARDTERARRRMEGELQQNLRSLSRSWRRNWISMLAGAAAGIASAFALLSWIDTAGIASAVAGAARSTTGFGTVGLLNTIIMMFVGAVIGAGVARWLVANAD